MIFVTVGRPNEIEVELFDAANTNSQNDDYNKEASDNHEKDRSHIDFLKLV